MSEADCEAQLIQRACASALKQARPKRLGIAVSGGGDSMALLDLMIGCAAEAGIPLEAVTVDHGLRSEAAQEAAFVARFCGERGIPHRTLRWNRPVPEGNLQAGAREARYRMIADWAREAGIDVVALGHTLDDQAETFLMRLARKSGVDGLAAMERNFERNGVGWIRPLLGRSRAELRRFLERKKIAWVEDPSNEDTKFERVRARNALAALAELGIDAAVVASVSHQLATAKWALNHYVHEESGRLSVEDRGDLVLTRHPWPSVPVEIDRRLIVAGLQWVGGLEYPPRRNAMVDMETALALDSDSHTLGGCLLSLAKPDGALNQKLRISREYNAVKDLRGPADRLWDGRWKLDGPHASDLEVRALGEAVKDCPDWRETGMPRTSLVASPAVWHGAELVAAPLAGLSNGWTAEATGRGKFADFLLSR